MPWGPSHSSRLRPVVTELPSDEHGGAAPLLSTRSLSTKGAMKLTLPLPGAGAVLYTVIPNAACQQPREPVCPLLQSFPLAVGKEVRGRSFDVIRESSLLAGWSFRSLCGPHAVSFEAKQMIRVDFKGPWMCSYKIKFCWCNSSVTPEDLVGQVLQEWSKNTVKI